MLENDNKNVLDWGVVDVGDYESRFEEVHKINHPKLICPEILNVNVDIFSACNNKLCQSKVTIVPGENVIHCTGCQRNMKSTSCIKSLEAFIEFETVTVEVPAQVLNEFLSLDVLQTYGDDINALVERKSYYFLNKLILIITQETLLLKCTNISL